MANRIYRTGLLALLVCSFLVGCSEADRVDSAESSFELAPADFDVPVSDRETILPAWQTEDEVAGDKADRFDARGGYQEIYGITAAPQTRLRSIAEFERTDGVLIDWDDYVSDFMLDLIREVALASPVFIMTDDLNQSRTVRGFLERNGVDTTLVTFFEFRNDAFWTRDFGPVPVAKSNREPAFVDHQYYPDRTRDDAVPTLMSRYFQVDVYRPNLATEGGNFMTNGDGLCVATEWLWQGNPGLTEREVDQIKRDYYGCDDLVVLERLEGEGTGHVDMFAKFISEDTVIVGDYVDGSESLNAAILDRNAQRLSNTRLADGTSLRVVRMPMPRATYPVYRSYTNSLIVNDTVIVPTYAADRRFESEALSIYRSQMPGYRVVAVPSDEVIELGGAVHCVTMGFNLDDIRGPGELRDRVDPVDPQPRDSARFTSEPLAPIRDLSRTSDTITASLDGTVEAVRVEVDIEHSYVGDLVVYLEHNGVRIDLQRFSGGAMSGLNQTYTVRQFSGMPGAGEWTLHVEDHAELDEGVLRSWALVFD